MPACVELPGPAFGSSAGESSSGDAGDGVTGAREGDVGESAATAGSAVKAEAKARTARIDT
jgi:hypothetical protein